MLRELPRSLPGRQYYNIQGNNLCRHLYNRLFENNNKPPNLESVSVVLIIIHALNNYSIW